MANAHALSDIINKFSQTTRIDPRGQSFTKFRCDNNEYFILTFLYHENY